MVLASGLLTSKAEKLRRKRLISGLREPQILASAIYHGVYTQSISTPY